MTRYGVGHYVDEAGRQYVQTAEGFGVCVEYLDLYIATDKAGNDVYEFDSVDGGRTALYEDKARIESGELLRD